MYFWYLLYTFIEPSNIRISPGFPVFKFVFLFALFFSFEFILPPGLLFFFGCDPEGLQLYGSLAVDNNPG